MKEKIKKILIFIIVIAIIYFGYNFLFKKDTYRGIFYPNGCLTCDDYIVSPDLDSAEDCVMWGEGLRASRKNPNDTWECGKNCKWKNGLSICETTFGMEGTGEHYTK
jgi:hypothetical protein